MKCISIRASPYAAGAVAVERGHKPAGRFPIQHSTSDGCLNCVGPAEINYGAIYITHLKVEISSSGERAQINRADFRPDSRLTCFGLH
jgi:hypothetical protein